MAGLTICVKAQRLAGWAGLALVLAVVSGCRHREKTAHLPPQAIPPPPAATYPAPEAYPPAPANMPPARIPPTPVPPGGVSAEDLDYVNTHQPVLSEEGLAT